MLNNTLRNNSTTSRPVDRKGRKKRQPNIGGWEKLLNQKVINVEFPGGKRRRSYLLNLEDGREVVATQRKEKSRASMESEVLKQLSKTTKFVPQLIATDGRFRLVQEKLEGARLSSALNTANDEELESLLIQALQSLSRLHHMGSESGFDHKFKAIGYDQEWINGLLYRPLVIGKHFKCIPKEPNLQQLTTLFKVNKPRFIKWDARPGNALCHPQGYVTWFDWEHCGVRNRLDDMAWLLCDEFVPNKPEIELRIINEFIDQFADQYSKDQAEQYLYTFGVFHSCVRLGLILSYKKDGSWWNLQKCIDGDKAGVTQQLAIRLCNRARRWAEKSEYTECLSPWFDELTENL